MARPRAGLTICERLRVQGDAAAGMGAAIFGRPLVARIDQLDEELWLTLIGKELLPSPVDVSRFLAGANALLQLEHPGLCEVRLIDREADECVVAVAAPMDAIPLEELTRTRCTPALIERLARELAGALAFLHSHQLVHGALEPSTVLVGDDRCCTWQWALLDLCSPTALAPRFPSTVAPEVRTGKRLSAASDVYAWGRLLAACVGATGEHDALLATWRERATGIPRELIELVESALEEDPQARPPDGGVLASWLGLDSAPSPSFEFEPNEVLSAGPVVKLPAELEPDEPSRMELIVPEFVSDPPPAAARPQTRSRPQPRPPSRPAPAPSQRPTASTPAPSQRQTVSSAATPAPTRHAEAEFDAVIGGLAPVPQPAAQPSVLRPPSSAAPTARAPSVPPAVAVNRAASTADYRPPRRPGPHGPSGKVLTLFVLSIATAAALGATALVAQQHQGLAAMFRGRAATLASAAQEERQAELTNVAAAVDRVGSGSEAEAGVASSRRANAAGPSASPGAGETASPPQARSRGAVRCPAEMSPIRRDGDALLCIDQGEHPGLRLMPDDDITLARARAICSGRGHRLCTLQEWQQACSGGSRKFPYGDEWQPQRCNLAAAEGSPSRVGRSGARDQCSTPEGVYDLVGNVGEWVEEGLVVGGDALTPYAECTSRARVPQGGSLEAVGVRCCATVEPS